MKKLILFALSLISVPAAADVCDLQDCEYIRRHLVKAFSTQPYTITWDASENSCPTCSAPIYEWRVVTENLEGVVTSGTTSALSAVVTLPSPGLYRFQLRECYSEDNPFTPEAESAWCSKWKYATDDINGKTWLLYTELPPASGGGID